MIKEQLRNAFKLFTDEKTTNQLMSYYARRTSIPPLRILAEISKDSPKEKIQKGQELVDALIEKMEKDQ